MQLLSKKSRRAILFWLGVIAVVFPTGARAFEGEEQPCPAFEGLTDFPSCEDCIAAGCGHVVDDKDCVSNCTDVTDSSCFSMVGDMADMTAAEICTEASNAGGGGGGAGGEEEEEICPTFMEGSETPTCVTCVNAGCGWTSDDGDCLKDCGEVNDGAACVSLALNKTVEGACGSSSGPAPAPTPATSDSSNLVKPLLALVLGAAAALV
jgi:hypothetical protein